MRVGSPSWGSERGPCAATVELPALRRLVGRSSVSMPATTPTSAHSSPTRGPDAAFIRPNQPTPLLGDPTRVAWHRMAVPRRGPGRLCSHRTVLRSGPADEPAPRTTQSLRASFVLCVASCCIQFRRSTSLQESRTHVYSRRTRAQPPSALPLTGRRALAYHGPVRLLR